jgi:hypothetical protein
MSLAQFEFRKIDGVRHWPGRQNFCSIAVTEFSDAHMRFTFLHRAGGSIEKQPTKFDADFYPDTPLLLLVDPRSFALNRR